MVEIPIVGIEDNKVFWRGTKIRCYQSSGEFEDYMLVHVSSDSEYLHVINISGHNPNNNGADLCSVKINSDNNELSVLASALKFSLGTEGVYILIE